MIRLELMAAKADASSRLSFSFIQNFEIYREVEQLVARQVHNLKAAGSNPALATIKQQQPMIYYQNELAVEVNWLVNNSIISKENYNKLAYRGKIKILRRGCNNTPALAAYESFPQRFRKLIDLKASGDPYKIAEINKIEELIQPNQAALDLFENFRLPDGRFLKPETRREYYANAIVLDAIHRYIINKKGKHSALGHTSKRSWDKIAEYVMELDRNKYPHNLPANPRRLEERYKQFRKEGPECLIHKNYMNKSAAKIDDEVKESFILELVSDPRNLDNEQIRGLYNQVAEKMNWKKITAATVAIWRDKLDLASYAGRRGSIALSNSRAMQVKRSAPTAPLYYLTLDGWDVELLYKKTENGTTTYHNRATVVIVLDAFSKYPLGYAIGTNETPELIKAALRNAMKHTQQLFGQMYRAHQVQSDRYSIKLMTPYYEAIADKSTPARAKNAKAKIIEPYFNRLNKTYCQLMPNWSGFGITSNKDKQPNVEFLNKYRHDFPDYEGVCKQIDGIVARERASKVEQYVSKFYQLPETDRLALPAQQYLLYFGEKNEESISMNGSGLHPTICGQKRDYDCFDLSFREYFLTQWNVLYDPDDLSQVLAVNEDGSRQYMMVEKYIQPMALKDRKPGDSDQLKLVRNYNKALEADIIDKRAKSAELVAATIAANPALEETTLRKLLIADSNGQHKNRLGEAKKAIGKIEKKEERKALAQWEEEQNKYLQSKIEINKYL